MSSTVAIPRNMDAVLPLSPVRIAWRKLRKNKFAMTGGFILIVFYIVAALAGFFSPYSPTSDEFRSLFFHPPTDLHFRDEQGRFHLKPYVLKSYLADRKTMTYSSGNPFRILYRHPASNLNPYFPDTIEQNKAVLTVRNESGEILAEVSFLQETADDSGVFSAAIPIDPQKLGISHKIVVEDASGAQREFRVSKRPSGLEPSKSDSIFSLADENGRFVSAYHFELTRIPIEFFVRSWKYKFFGIIPSDLHLFGTREPGQIFLFGTDQIGRDIFSRVLYGAQISLTVGLVGVLLTTLFGLILGGIAGYYGGITDQIIMRISELLISIPALYLILCLRNIVPDRMEDFYEKVERFAVQTFAWHDNPIVFGLIMLAIVLLLSYYIYRKGWNASRFGFSLALVLLLGFGPGIVRGVLSAMKVVVPGSTHLTSEWSYLMIIAILSTVGWAAMSRIIRGMVLALREEEYVLAARAAGASDARIIFRHILPNTFSYVIVRASLLIPAYILGEVALSFLSVGVQEPTPSWGNMLAAAQNLHVLQEFSWTLIPGVFIFLTVLAFNFLGDGLRDALDPKFRV